MATNRPAPELPGFYFDPEKNRYFRLRPGTNNHNPLTQEIIRKRVEQTKTNNDGKSWHENNGIPTKKIKICAPERPGIVELLRDRSLGLDQRPRPRKFQFSVVKSRLKSSEGIKIDAWEGHGSEGLVMGLLPNEDYSELLTLATSRSSIREGEFATEIRNLSKKDPSSVRLEMAKVGGVCFASIDSNRSGSVLFTKLNHSMVVLRHRGEWKYRSAKTAFSCAASKNPNCRFKLSYSDGKRSIFVSNSCHFWGTSSRAHPRGGAGFTVRTLPSDVMSQCFSYSPHLHYNGIRTGAVIGLDLRIRSHTAQAQTMIPKFRSNATRLQTLSNEFSLLVGYTIAQTSPSIYLWDVRFPSRPVLNYESNCISERYYVDGFPHDHIFQLNIDKDEEIITSISPDLKARLWSISTGELVRTYPENPDTGKVTAAAYTRTWNMLNRQPGGLLMHVHNKGDLLLPL